MYRVLCIPIALLCLAGTVHAHRLRNSGGQFRFVPEREFYRVVADEFFPVGLPGHPELPVRHLTYILPPGVKADSVEFEKCDYALLGEYYIYPAQPSVPLCSVPPWVPPDSVIYNSKMPYPAAPVEIINQGFFDGASVVTVAVYPLRYIPAKREVYVASQIEFDFFTSDTRSRVRPRVRDVHAQQTYDRALKAIIENRQDIPAYYQPPALVPERAPETRGQPGFPIPAQYTILTHHSLSAAFQPYADWLTDKGVPAKVVHVENVLPHFSGVDDAEKLREYLKYGYENCGLVWVLLGGDAGIVPFRYGWTSTAVDTPGNNSSDVAPSDLYFSDLEGDWDVDGDRRWGEPGHDDVQVYPQVFVGRLTVRESDKVQNWVNKMLYYEKYGSPDLNQFNRAYWVYDSSSLTVGCPIYPRQRTRALFPGHFVHANYNARPDARIVRDAFGRWDGNVTHLPAGIYNGNCHGDPRNFACRSERGDPKKWWVVWSKNPYSESEHNAGLEHCNIEGQHYIVYDIGCYTAAFDPFIYHGSHKPSDTIMSDAYTNLYPTTLGIAHLGNTRNGRTSTDPIYGGRSDKLQHAFWELFFATASPSVPASALGVAQGLSKVAYQESYTRHVHNLFGSPELEPWMIAPDSMFVQAPSWIPQGVPTLLHVQVTDGWTGVSGVQVCLHKPNDIYEVGVTYSGGIAEFIVCAQTPGEILITCTYSRTGNRQFLPRQAVSGVITTGEGGPQAGLPQELGFTPIGPSPALSAFSVQYGVPVQGRVELLLYDVQGRLAAVVRDEELEPGYYRQDVSKRALSLPAGVYFLSLAQNGKQVTSKVTLVE